MRSINSKEFWGVSVCVYRDLSLGFYLCLYSRSDNSENKPNAFIYSFKAAWFCVNMLSIPLEEDRKDVE
jgi:hypothetical protein